MTTPPTPRRLHEHINDALVQSAQRVLTAHPERRTDLDAWLTTAHEHILIRAAVDRRADGRIDTRSYRLDIYVTTTAGPAPLVSVRRRDLLVPEVGRHEDPQAECRTLLHQLGYNIPDDPSDLDVLTDDPNFPN